MEAVNYKFRLIVASLSVAFLLLVAAFWQPQAAYAADDIASGTWGTCPWEISADGTLTVHPGKGANRPMDAFASPWNKWARKVKHVVFEKNGSQKVIAPERSNALLSHLWNARTIDLRGLDTSNVTDMRDFFMGCEKVKHINLKPLKTENATNMSNMFNACASLESIDLAQLDTSNVVGMSYMFASCKSLKTLDIEHLNTSKAKYINGMFAECTGLKTLDISQLDTSNVESMEQLFYGCSSLQSVNLNGISVPNLAYIYEMFCGCKSLKSIDWQMLDAPHVEEMTGLFAGCKSLKTVDLSPFDSANVKDIGYMFSYCKSLKTIDLSPLKNSNVTNMNSLFSNCTALESIDMRPLDSSGVSSMYDVFNGCTSLKVVDLRRCDTSAVKDMRYMFSKCKSLQTLKLGKKFAFKGKRIFDEYYEEDGGIYPTGTKGCSLPNVRAKKPYAGMWAGPDGTGLTSGQLWKQYSGKAMSGTWTWAMNITSAKTAKIADRTYDGQAKRPKVTVTFGKKTLKAGQDYTVSYENNIKPGVAKAVIKGKGKYAGSKTVKFKIVKRNEGSGSLKAMDAQASASLLTAAASPSVF